MKSSRQRTLCLERLEAREVPATFGNAWADPLDLTTSFATDKAQIGGASNQLYQLLGAHLNEEAWQSELLRAIQTWAAVANLNVGLVGDDGGAFGSSVFPQGDPAVGDIRWGATALDGTELAQAFAFQPVVGSWSGDILLNSNAAFGDGADGTFDLFTVALHEVGHALGLDHSDAPDSVLSEGYLGVRTGLSAQDVLAVRTLYGARQEDAFDRAATNNTAATATHLGLGGVDGAPALTLRGDITTARDVDFYRFTAPVSGAIRVGLETGGISLLTGEVTLYDAKMRVVASLTNADPRRTGALTLTPRLTAGPDYYIRVRASEGSAFGVGAYQLQVGAGTTPPQDPAATTWGTLLAHSPAATTKLTSTTGSSISTVGTLGGAGDTSAYEFTLPAGMAGAGALSLTAASYAGGGVAPQVELYNAAGARFDGQILVNGNGQFTLQVAGNWAQGETFAVRVTSPGGPSAGVFGLTIQWTPTPVAPRTIAETTLGATCPQATQTWAVEKSELAHFLLSAAGPQATAGVRLTILDAQGNLVGSLLARAGETASANFWLGAGSYRLIYTAATSDGSELQPLAVVARVIDTADPIEPYTIDTTADPATTTTTTVTTTTATRTAPTTTTTVTTATTLDPSLAWWLESTFLSPTAPTSKSFWY